MPRFTRRNLGLLGLVLLIAGVHGWSLLRYPEVFVDEAWFASRAWGFLQTGRAFGALDHGVFERFDGYWTFLPWLGTWIQSWGLRWSATPSLLGVRIVSLVFGFVLLAQTYFIGSRLISRTVGLVALGLLAGSYPFFLSAHWARYDIFTAVFGYGGVVLFLLNRRERLWLDALAGLCVGLAVEIHAFGAIFVPCVAALYVLRYRQHILKQPRFWSFIAGGVVALLIYLGLHVVRYPTAFVQLNALQFGPTHTPPLLADSPRVLWESLRDLVGLYGTSLLALAPLFVVAIIWALRRRTPALIVLLSLNGVLFSATLLLIRAKQAYYGIFLAPAALLLVAAWMVVVVGRLRLSRSIRTMYREVVVILALANTLLMLQALRPNQWAEYRFAHAAIKPFVPASSTILSAQTYWFDFANQPYYSWEQLIFYRRYKPASTLAEAFAVYKPDIFILDGHIRGFIVDQPRTDGSYSQALELSRPELNAILAERATLVTSFDVPRGDTSVDHVEVYRFEW